MTYDVLDIAEYVVYFANTKECRINVLQLMKILYFIQAQFLVSKKQRAFSEDIIAWNCGPMEELVWRKYRIYGNAFIPVIDENGYPIGKESTKKILKSDMEMIDGIVELMLNFNNTSLFHIIDRQPPFVKALKHPSHKISDKDMMEFFK